MGGDRKFRVPLLYFSKISERPCNTQLLVVDSLSNSCFCVAQLQKGFEFESETDTEVIAKLIKHLHDTHSRLSFRELVEQVILQLVSNMSKVKMLTDVQCLQEGAFALAFKSTKYPGQLVATRRGSPLLVGIKTKSNLVSDHIPIIFGSKGTFFLCLFLHPASSHLSVTNHTHTSSSFNV